MSPGEFQTMIDNLVEAKLITTRIEDDITYYDSTTLSDTYKQKKLKEIEKYVQDCLALLAEKWAEGTTEALIKNSGMIP